MRRITVFVVAALVCCSLPTWVCAEGFLPSTLPWSFDGATCAVRRVSVSWPSVSAAWLESSRGLVLGGSFDQLGGQIGLDAGVPTKGLWLGASETIGLGGSGRVLFDGRYLFPTATDFSYFLNNYGAPAFSETRKWALKMNRWYLGGTAYYQIGESGSAGCSALVGLRYDYQYALGTDPQFISHPVGGGVSLITSIPQDEMDITFSNWVPYIGLRCTYGGAEASASAEIKGFPWIGTRGEVGLTTATGIFPGPPALPRRWTFQQSPRTSYFLEFSADYRRRMYGSMISLFADVSAIHAVDLQGSLEAVGGTGFDPLTLPAGFPARFSVDRLEGYVGAEITLGF